MEKLYIKSRIDCPPPETKQLIKEKDLIIQKQQEKIRDLEFCLSKLRNERDFLFNALNHIIFSLNLKEKKELENESQITNSGSSSSSNSTSSLSSSPNSIDLASIDYMNKIQFLSDEYVQLIQQHLQNKLMTDNTNKETLLSTLLTKTCNLSLNKLDSQCSLIVPSSMSSLSLITSPTPPASSTSSSLSSLKQKAQTIDQIDSEQCDSSKSYQNNNNSLKIHLTNDSTLKHKNINSSISSSIMISSPNVKKTLKNTISTVNTSNSKPDGVNRGTSCGRMTTINNFNSSHEPQSLNSANNQQLKYEMSNDLHQKQIEILNRKYGGHLRARRAARTIQLAYRAYKLRKNYAKICEINMKRRSIEIVSSDLNHKTQLNKFSHVNYEISKNDDERLKMNIDLPSVDFEHLVEQLNTNNNQEGNLVSNVSTNRRKNVVTAVNDSSINNSVIEGDYKNLDEDEEDDDDYKTYYDEVVDYVNEELVENFDEEIDSDPDNEYYKKEKPLRKSTQKQHEKLNEYKPACKLIDQIVTENVSNIFGSTSSISSLMSGSSSSPVSPNNIVKSNQTCVCEISGHKTIVSSPQSTMKNRNDKTVTEKLSTRSTPKNRNETQTEPKEKFDDSPLASLLAPKPVKQRLNFSIDNNQNHSQQLKSCHSSVHSVYSSISTSSSSNHSNKSVSTNHISSKNHDSNFTTSENLNLKNSNRTDCLSPSYNEKQSRILPQSSSKNSNKQPIPKNRQNGSPLQNVLSKEYDLNKRKYLVGLNLFNRKPEKGINYLIEEKFLDRNPKTIAEFLYSRNCISKQMIGEYISNTQDKFIKEVLHEFIRLIDLRNMPVDESLRKFQSHFRMPGEAQKIEHLTRMFSTRYIECNKLECKNMFNRADDTIDVLAYAIILLNTSIHNPNVKPNEKMKFEQFLKMTKGIDNGFDIEKEYLQGLYDRIKQNEFKPGKDHTNSVMDFEKNLVGPKKPTTLFALPHRRLVCLVQLYEICDLTKKEKPNSHQRDCFLFNDILVVCKVFSKKKNNTLYTYRCGFPLHGMSVVLFVTNHYQYGIRLIRMPEKKVLITFNARNENDQQLFCRDLAESIAESNEIEALRIKNELEKYKPNNLANFTKLNTIDSNISIPEKNNQSNISIKPSKLVTIDTKPISNRHSSGSTASSVKSSSSNASSTGISTSNLPSSKVQRLAFSNDLDHTNNNNRKNICNSPTSPISSRVFSNQPQNTLTKRTLSNSLLDLNGSKIYLNGPSCFQGAGLQRAGSDCSIFNSNNMIKPRFNLNRDSQIIRSQELFEIGISSDSTEKQSLVENYFSNHSHDSPSRQEKINESKTSNDTVQSILKTSKSFQSTNEIIMSKFYCLNQNPNEELENKINEFTENDSEEEEEAVKSAINRNFTETCNKNENNDSTLRQNQRNNSAKYFTMSSTAGQKFKQIFKKYV